MVVNALLAILSAVAANASQQPVRCTSQQIVAAGKVSEIELKSSDVALELQAPGLRITDADEVSWTSCSVRLQARVYGGWGITDTGIPVIPNEQHLITRDDAIPAPEAEPPHPIVSNATFISSTGLAIGDQRAGLWSRSDGSFLIARYHPGQAEQPTPILVSKDPVLGLFYLGAPDSPGGAFQLWQRLLNGRYRYVRITWSEEGVR